MKDFTDIRKLSCRCPEDRDKGNRRCGKRAASERDGGASNSKPH